MNFTALSNRRALFAVAAVTVMIMASVTAVSTESEAETNDESFVRGISVSVYDQNTVDYGSLAYMSEKLPDTLHATKWYRSSADRLWHNIDWNDPGHGSILTYGDLSNHMSVEEIREDIAAFKEVSANDFAIFQVSFTSLQKCNVSYTIIKSGTVLENESVDVSLSVDGFSCRSAEYVGLYTVGPGCDFEPEDVRGTYGAEFRHNGEPIAVRSVDYAGEKFCAKGKVVDADGNALPDALVEYAVDGGTTEHGYTDDAGEYRIFADRGSNVKITGVVSKGYSFKHVPQDSGSLYGDYVFQNIASNERTLNVRVLDKSDRPAVGISVSARWYTDNRDPVTLMYKLAFSEENITVLGVTDSEGCAKIAYGAPALAGDCRLLVKGLDNVKTYTFDINETGGDTPSPHVFGHPGNVSVAPGTDSASIRAEQSSVFVSVNGATDSAGNGGAPLSGTTVTAQWYYQFVQSGTYYHRYSDVPEEHSEDIIPGTAFVTGKTDESGKTLVVYLEPVGTVPDYSAYLYVAYAVGPSIYGYTLPTAEFLAGSTYSMTDLVNANGGCDAAVAGSVSVMNVVSDDVAYTISGKVNGTGEGTVPINLNVYYTYQNLTYSNVVGLITDGTHAEFGISVKSGESVEIELAENDQAEYVFSNKIQIMPSVFSDSLEFVSDSAKTYAKTARSAPVNIDTYTVSGLDAGETVTFGFAIGGQSISIAVMATSSGLAFDVSGREGNRVEGLKLTGDTDIYIPEFTGNSATAYRVAQVPVVTFADRDSSGRPVLANVLPSQTIRIYADGIEYATVVTGANGTGTVPVPNVSDVVYKYVDGDSEYTVTAVPVADGPFAGYTAIDLHGIADIDDAVMITVNVEYVSSSGMENSQPAVKTNIFTDPFTKELRVGDTIALTAPELEGFRFSGWFIGGVGVSDRVDPHQCILLVEESYAGETITAAYSPLPHVEPEKGVDPVALAIGLVAIMVAILAFGYVILQNRRY